MAFINFPLVIIFLSIILAVWWLIKKASLPSSLKDEPRSTKQLVVLVLLWIITGVYSLALIPAYFMAIMSMMGPPGSFGLDELVMVSFPVTILVSVVSAWILYRRRIFGFALLVTLLPIACLAGSYNGLVVIRSDQRGVVISAFEPKGYRTEPLEPGTHWITPFVESVQLYSIAPQTYIMSKESNDEIQARTKDNQQVLVGVTVIYAINPSSVIDLHATWQNRYEENVVRPVTRAAIRDVILHYSVAEINGEKKVVIQQSIADEMKQGLIDNYLILIDFTIQEVHLN